MNSSFPGYETQLTYARQNHTLTTCNAFTCDSREIAYDNRTPGRGDNAWIETVGVDSKQVRIAYKNSHGARAAVVTCHPFERKIVFIKGLDDPEINGAYHLTCRQGAIADLDAPGEAVNLDARNIYPPFTPGALRGGSHVHVWHPDGTMISNTYEDAVLYKLGYKHDCPEGEANLRNIEINLFGKPVNTPALPGNLNGATFTYAAALLHSDPAPGSDEIMMASEEGFIGRNGYIKPDGTRQGKALACVGKVLSKGGEPVQEVYVIDLPDGDIVPGDGPLEGTATTRPRPPKGVVQRRVTHLCGRKYPGICGMRHWLRSTPDGAWIVFFSMDDDGIVQVLKFLPQAGISYSYPATPLRPIPPIQSLRTENVCFMRPAGICS